MLVMCICLMALGAIALGFYLREKIKSYSVKAVLLKAIVSILFVAVAAISAYVSHGHVLNVFIILGLLFGLTGDIWLDLKYVYPKDDKLYTYAGFGVFGVGHILFITGMMLEFLGNGHPLYVIVPMLVAVIMGVANLLLAKPLKQDFGDLKWVVFAYSITLFSMPLSALSLLILNGFAVTSLWMIFIGGLLFAISDLVLSGTYFGKGHERPIDFILNYLTYYPAQFMIAFSLFFLS